MPVGLMAAIAGAGGRPDVAALGREVRAFVDGGVMCGIE